MPSVPSSRGRIIIMENWKTTARRKEMVEEITPLPKAVKKPEEKTTHKGPDDVAGEQEGGQAHGKAGKDVEEDAFAEKPLSSATLPAP